MALCPGSPPSQDFSRRVLEPLSYGDGSRLGDWTTVPGLNISFPFLVAKRLQGTERAPDPTPWRLGHVYHGANKTGTIYACAF